LGLRLLTLIECVVHRQLTQTQATLTGLYPENPKKSTNRPSTERILKVFDHMTLTIFTVDRQSHRHLPPLTPLQSQIIKLLGFSPRIYNDLLDKSGVVVSFYCLMLREWRVAGTKTKGAPQNHLKRTFGFFG
jgi:hypothetical protein